MKKQIRSVKQLSKTRNKLKEARFFLEKLREKNVKVPDINFYLSAFISAARSVLWIMRAEYKDVAGWKEWYDSIKPSSSEKKFLKGMTEIRNRSIKEEPLQLYGSVSVIIPKESQTEELKQWIIKQHKNRQVLSIKFEPSKHSKKVETFVGADRVITTGRVKKVFFNLEEFPSKDIVSVCTKYFKLLNKMVRECESRFGMPVVKLTKQQELDRIFNNIMSRSAPHPSEQR